MTDGFKFTPIHRELIQAVERVQQATDALHELWSESGSDASDIMHDSAVNYWYPFNDELGQVVFKMEAWRAVLAREKDCCPCDGCGEVVMSDETHGEGPEWLCCDCYSMWKKCAACGREMSDDECGDELPEERVCDTCAGIECEDAGCPDHGIDAMPERWAEDAGVALIGVESVLVGEQVTCLPISEATGEADPLHGLAFTVISKNRDMMGDFQLRLNNDQREAALRRLRHTGNQLLESDFDELFPAGWGDAHYSVSKCVEIGGEGAWGDNGHAVVDGELHGPGVTVLWQLESETQQGVVSVWREFIETPVVCRIVLTDEAGIQDLAMQLLKQHSE